MKRKVFVVGSVLCSLILCGSLLQIFRYYSHAEKAEEEFEKLAEIVEQDEEPDKDAGKENEIGEQSELPAEKRYLELYRQNSDMAGWIFIEGTGINYLVMYTPDYPDFYLKHNFDKEYSDYGVPYIAEQCDPAKPSDNLTIYGHHMNNGSMFTGLMKYTEKNFYEKHKVIRFDRLTVMGEYEVIAVFKTTVYGITGFPYYLFSDAENEDDFNAYVEKCKSLALYDTGVTAKYGDKLISLSTCEYSRTNGRLVVVAKFLK